MEAKRMFTKFMDDVTLFNGKIPPFETTKITHQEWVKIKKNTDLYNDHFFDVPNDAIRKAYAAKKCQYIQISNGFGLFHLGNDLCNFKVPIFAFEQQIRVRTKVHTRVNKKGFCDLSITAALQPKSLSAVSPFSLDDKAKLPENLKYEISS